MFLQNNDDNPKSLSEIISAFREEFADMASSILNFETQAKKITADIFGQGTAFADSVRISLAGAAKNTAELGLRVDDLSSTYGAIAQQMRTNVMLTDEQIVRFAEFQKATNITAEQVGEIVEGFATLGIGPTKAAEQMSNMAKTSRQYGLNTAQFMEKVGDNLKLMNSYNFRDGVEGFTRMVARSQALRINMSDVTGLAAKLLDPSEAINLAAQFQVLGGAVGALADPFQLMNMAQNDIEGLQDTILEAASAAVTFNETTGKFQIGATEMRRLRAQAEALGMDYEELANTATKTAERNQKLDYLQFLDATPEQKEMLASMGQLEGGEVKVKVQNEEGKDVLVSASEALKYYGDQLGKMTDESKMDDRTIAIRQMNALEEIQKALLTPMIQVQAEIAGSDAFTEIRGGIKETAESIAELSNKMIGDSGVVTESITNFYKYFKEGIDELAGGLKKPTTYEGMMENFKEGGKYLTRSLIDAFEYVYLGITKTMSVIQKDKIRESFDINIGGVVDRVRGGDSGDNNIGGGVVNRFRESNFGDYTVNNPLPVNLAKVENDVTVKIDPLTMNFEDLNVNHGGTIQLQGVGGVDLNNLTSTQLQELSSKLKTYMVPSNILGT
jgi:hypothetical protein